MKEINIILTIVYIVAVSIGIGAYLWARLGHNRK